MRALPDERWFEVAGFWKRTQSRKAAKKMRAYRMRGGLHWQVVKVSHAKPQGRKEDARLPDQN